MSSFRKLAFLLRNWRQILGLDTSVRDQTAAIRHELERLREHRRVVEAAREKKALQDLRRLVAQMKTLEKDLDIAEKAAVKLVDSLGEQANQQLEADLLVEADLRVEAEVAKMKAAMRSGANIVPDGQGGPPPVTSDAPETQAAKS